MLRFHRWKVKSDISSTNSEDISAKQKFLCFKMLACQAKITMLVILLPNFLLITKGVLSLGITSIRMRVIDCHLTRKLKEFQSILTIFKQTWWGTKEWIIKLTISKILMQTLISKIYSLWHQIYNSKKYKVSFHISKGRSIMMHNKIMKIFPTVVAIIFRKLT